MNILLHPSYFPSIATFVAIVQAENLWLEVCDNYQKQTYRNRMFIYDANGKLPLTIPVIYSQNNRQLYRDILIANDEDWQELHWKTIKSAYNNSPFFEFYEHDFQHLFNSEYEYLMDFNFKCMQTIFECLELPFKYETSKKFEKKPENLSDYRSLINNRKELQQQFNSYVQVFDDKYGFISNLSILDLIFNEGPNALLYLENQKIEL